MPLINQATVDTATTGKTQGKDAVWAKQTVTIGFHRHLNLKVIVTDALMGEHSPALGGVRKSSCVRSLERGDENEYPEEKRKITPAEYSNDDRPRHADII